MYDGIRNEIWYNLSELIQYDGRIGIIFNAIHFLINLFFPHLNLQSKILWRMNLSADTSPLSLFCIAFKHLKHYPDAMVCDDIYQFAEGGKKNM